jgi:antitoxin component of MazEF toxin-antitoxin module
MIRKITKIGNSQGIILDSTVMDLAHLKVGDEVNLEIHRGGTLTVVPVDSSIEPEQAAARAREIIAKNDQLFRRLS